MSDLRSATVNITVPSLKEETPEVTVSPSSTPFLMITPVIGAVTRACCVAEAPEMGMPWSSTILYRDRMLARESAARSREVWKLRSVWLGISPASKSAF